MGRHVMELTGQRFGRLVVEGYSHAGGDNNGSMWVCRCDCGETPVARGKDLRLGTTKSCGCGKRSSGQRNRATKASPFVQPGMTFGRLTVGELHHRTTGSASGGHRFFNCTCECGGESIVRANLLSSGQTKSCGCLKRTAWQRRPAPTGLAV